MKIAAGRADGFVRNPDAQARAVLLYGADDGLIRERADIVARSVVEDPSDPFRVAQLTAGQVARDPALLADEAAAIAMTGGQRVIRLREAGDDVAGAVGGVLDEPVGDTLIVIEADNLPPRSALRRLCEGAANAAAVACYADTGAGLAQLIDDVLGAADISIDRDARDYLLANLGGDRQLSRRELEKLCLYVGSGGPGPLPTMSWPGVGDSSVMTLDDLLFAVAGGDVDATAGGLRRVREEGVGAGHRPARHATACAAAAPGRRPTSRRPRRGGRDAPTPTAPVFWKQQQAFKQQQAQWSTQDLEAALAQLTAAEVESKTTALPGPGGLRARSAADRAVGRARARLARIFHDANDCVLLGRSSVSNEANRDGF